MGKLTNRFCALSVRLSLLGLIAGSALIILHPARAMAADVYQIGQQIQVREGDTWSAASIVQHEGRKYLIHYTEADSSTDEWVGTDRMRALGGASSAGAAPANTPAAAAPKPDAAPPARQKPKSNDMFAMPDEVIAQTEPNRTGVDVDEPAAAPASWSVAPDPVAKPVATQSYSLRTNSADKKMGVQQVLPCASGGAVLGFANFGEKERTVERVGTASGSLRATLPAQCQPMAASPSGTLLVCRCSAFGFGNNSRIDAFTLSTGAPAATPLVSFTPYPPASGDGKGEDIRFVAALSDTRIITCDLKGRLIAWDISAHGINGVWRVDVGPMHFDGACQNVVLSPGGKWLATSSNAGITFVDPANGHVLGAIPSSSEQPVSNLCCSPTGKTLIGLDGDAILVSFDVAIGKRLRRVALPSNAFGAICCPSDGFALVNARQLIDANTGALVPQFQPSEGATVATTALGMTWLASNAKLSIAHIPDDAVRTAVEAAGDSMLALKPGMTVSLDIQLDLSDDERTAVEASIRKKLLDNGLLIAPSADTVVSCRTQTGDPHEHVYRKSQAGMPVFMGMGAGGTSMILNDKVTSITIQQKGQTIWERKRISGPANSFKLKDGQSLEDGARESIKYDPKFLESVLIPDYIAEPQPDAPKSPAHRPRHVQQ